MNSKVTTKAMAKVAAVATGLAMATSMLALAPMAHAAALTSSQVQSILSLLSSFGADSTTIANVQASLTGGTPSSTTSGSTTTTTNVCSFTKDLTMKSSGAEVTSLQQALINGGYSIPAGATGYFGAQTRAAVIAWQKAKGVTPSVGYFGPKSRAAFNLTCSGSSTTTTTTTTTGTGTVTGTGLKVSLSPTSPNGSVLVTGQGIGDLADFTFSNPTSAPINVTGLTFNRTGVSSDSTLTNVYLYNGGTRLTDSAGISNSQFSYSNSAGLFTVAAGGTYTVSVRSDIATGSSGQQLGVSLVSVTSSGTLDSSVSFPINGGYQTISAATMATVQFTQVAATPTAAITVSAQNDYPVWQDNVSVNTNPVKLTSLKFMNLGSADSSAITNLRLYVDGVQAGSAVAVLGADRSVTFDLSSAPMLLSESTHVVKVLANITNAAASRTVQFSVQRSSDTMFVDSQLGQPVAVTSGGTTSFSTVSTAAITIQSANAGVSVSKDPASPSQNIAVGSTNVMFASFDMLASGENVKVSDLSVSTSNSGGLNNGKIMVNGIQVGSTKAITTAAVDFSLGSSLILPAGQNTVVSVYADANDTTGTALPNNTSVTITLAAGASNGQGVSSYQTTAVPASPVTGNAVVVSNSTLSASASTSYGNQTIISGSNNAHLGSFVLSTGSTASVSVNTINVTFPNPVSSTITNLTLMQGSTVLGTVITTPSQSNSFSVNFTIPASSSQTIDIYGNILSGANAGTIIASVGTGTTGTDSSGQSRSVSAVALQTITLGSGSLTVTRGAGDPVSNNVLAGASSVMVGEFNFAAANSAYTVHNLTIHVPYAQANDVSNVTVSYKDVNGATQTATQALVNGTSGNATATFQGLTMYVPANDSANLDVSVGIPTITSNATSGAGINVTLGTGASTGTFNAVDSAGNATTTINAGVGVASNGTFYVRKSIPTFAVTSVGGSAVGSPLYQFSITADPAGAVEWSQLTFSIATSSTAASSVTGFYLTDNASSGVSLLDANVNATGVTGSQKVTINLDANNTNSKYQQIAAGATKVYNLYATNVAGYTTGSTISVGLASDGTYVANAAAASLTAGNNVVWSDRSSTSHSITSTDWTNGYLLKNFTGSQISYSK